MIHAMNKDKYVTNSAKCMKLVNQNLGAAKLLEQIMYWARYTKHEDDLGNRIVCFTHDEWAEITGMTISQVKYGLRKLREMRLVTTKNAPHLYKSGKLRTVHIYISEDLYDQYYADQNMARITPIAHCMAHTSVENINRIKLPHIIHKHNKIL